LSHPLTIVYVLNKGLSDLPSSTSSSSSTSICIIGARSELTLPKEYWNEIDLQTNTINNIDTNNNSTASSLDIGFPGPEVTLP